MAARTFRRCAAVQASLALVLGVTTEARDVISDASGVMKIVAAMTFMAGTVHDREREGWLFGEGGKIECSGGGAGGTGQPGAQPAIGRTVARGTILLPCSMT